MGANEMLTPITHNRRRVLGAAAATLATGALALAGAAELRPSTPLTGVHPMSDRLLKETPSRLRSLVRSIVHHLPGETGELPVEGHLPSFAGATGWLNSEALTPEGLQGRVVLVDFWTYTCVNWLRTLPYVRACDAQGRIRYHHFGEGEYAMTEMAIQQLLVEAGAKDVAMDLVSVDPVGLEVAAAYQTLRSPETYLGYGQATGMASPDGLWSDEAHDYAPPPRLRLNEWAPAGGWAISRRAATATAAN